MNASRLPTQTSFAIGLLFTAAAFYVASIVAGFASHPKRMREWWWLFLDAAGLIAVFAGLVISA